MKKIYILALLPILVILLNACSASQNVTPATPTESSNPTSQTQNDVNEYDLNEVEKHATESDCWMAIEGRVYDVTDFVAQHPGGKAILNGCGKDATTLFNERPTNNKGPHPAQAMQQLEQFVIGNLKK